MPIRMLKKGKPASQEQLQEFKQLMGNSLLNEYFEFLSKYNGGTPETNEFAIGATGNGSGVNEFLSTSEVICEKERLRNRIPAPAWPIAYAEGGNYVCIASCAQVGVYFWDHELEAEEGEEPTWANMFLLAKTFSEFWEKLRPFDVNNIELKPGQVKSVWVDPDFKPEF